MDAQSKPTCVARSRERRLALLLLALVLASGLWEGYGRWLLSGGGGDAW